MFAHINLRKIINLKKKKYVYVDEFKKYIINNTCIYI